MSILAGRAYMLHILRILIRIRFILVNQIVCNEIVAVAITAIEIPIPITEHIPMTA
jgi:hypothetical protein